MIAGLIVALALCAESTEFEKQLEARVNQLVKANGNGTHPALKRQLIAMYKRDQEFRTRAYTSGNPSEAMVRQQEQRDNELTAELKQIVAEKGWPDIRLVGLRASENAALVLAHSRDRDFQRQMLPRLQELAESGRILGSEVAGLVDKILVSEDKPQRFGSQFRFVNGRGEMLQVEDPDHLEERRARYLLAPMIEYKKMLGEMYHLKID